MFKLTDLIENSNTNINSFIIHTDTAFYKQNSDMELEMTNYIAKKKEIYDGILVMKRNNNFYIDIGWDQVSNGNLFIPVVGYPLNVIIKN